jgi:hypothetical protein
MNFQNPETPEEQDFFMSKIPQGETVILATRKGRRVSGREYPAGFYFYYVSQNLS